MALKLCNLERNIMFLNDVSKSDKKRLFSNFISLAFLQAANYILPLLTVPYLVKTVGYENFGMLSFATALISYFIIITDYGFNLTATKDIAANRDNADKIVEIYSSVMTIKVILAMLSLVALSIIVFSFEKLRINFEIYLFTFGIVLGNILLPIWFFQGMEKMKYITYLNVISKLVFTLCIFIFVQKQSDYYLVPILTSIGFVVGGGFSLIIVRRKFNIRFKIQTWQILMVHFKNGWHIFVTSVFSGVLSNSSVLILGVFNSNEVVGIYSAIEKVVKAISSLFSIFTQSIFPYLSNRLAEMTDIQDRKGLVFKFSMPVLLIIFCLLLIAAVFSNQILSLLYSEVMNDYSYIFQMLLFWVFIAYVNNFIGIQYLTNLNHGKYYMRAFAISGICSIILFFILSYFMASFGVAIAIVFGELILTISMLIFIVKYRL